MFAHPEDHVSQNMKSISDTYEVQVLIAYFLDKIERPCTPAQLLEIATSDGVVNYFVYSEVIEKMLENGNVEIADSEMGEVYKLTEKGRVLSQEFKKMIPRSFRDKILAAGLRLFAKLRSENSVEFEIKPHANGYIVRCVSKDVSADLMDLSLYASDEEQANFIRSKIMLDPSGFYSKIIDFVVGNEEYVPDLSEDIEQQE